MAQYEMMVLTQTLMETQKIALITERLEAVLKKVKGTITLKNDMGERQLAYKVAGQDRGYYVVYLFEVEKSALKEINKQLRLIKEILRYLVTKIEVKK